VTSLPVGLRAQLEADYAPVRPLASPWTRVTAVLPLAVVSLVAAPIVFDVRADATQLGWAAGWGASFLQAAIGLLVIVASLRESIPGRQLPAASVALGLMVPVALVLTVTLAVWNVSQVALSKESWWIVGGLCLAGSAASALPVVAIASVLAARAYPLRPSVAGALLGAGAGLIADAGWRMFCHYTEPEHVLSAHLGGVVVAAVIGSWLTGRLTAGTRAPQTSTGPR
jgi:hypothetical protein